MEDLGFALRLARERRGLTQTQVMQLTGVNNKTLSGYENGISEPDLQTLAALLRLYRASADELLHLNGDTDGPPDEDRLLSLYRALPPGQRQELLLVLETLLAHRNGGTPPAPQKRG